jgi:pyruvate dehydrogenase E1 component alpha subunit
MGKAGRDYWDSLYADPVEGRKEMTTEVQDLTDEQLVDMYRNMLRVRTFEMKAADEFAKGVMPGFVHLSVGQEAIAVGTVSCLRDDDFVSPTHRGHGCLIMKGMPMRGMFAEMLGRKTGVCGGKGCSFHMGDLSLGIYEINGILGSSAPIATGSALAMRKAGTDQVHLSYFGDGQSNLGSIHEAMNFAAIHKLPVVYVCENNQFGISMRQSDAQAIEDIADRAAAYGFPGVAVDGNDVIAVYEVTQEAVKRAREGEGPTLIECKTYRWRGHFEGDPTPYRTEEEVEAWMERGPIKRLRERLISLEILTDEEAEQIVQEVQQEVDAAYQQAWDDPMPAPEDALVLGY